MKKIFFIAAAALLALSANAQDKEALKAEKAAIKEAEKLVKNARTSLDMAKPNPQYGRKELNMEKLDAARDLIKQAVDNKYVNNNAETWKVAADVAQQYYTKLDAASKDDESQKPAFYAQAAELADYAIKYDSLYNIDPKKKEQEYKTQHIFYQQYGANAALNCLQAAQNLSNSESQEDLKNAVKYADVVERAFGSSLLADFENPNKGEWIEYGKIFKAQSLVSIEGVNPADVEAAYAKLKGTKYETTAYSALCNFFREKDTDKYVYYLQEGMKNSNEETYPSFAFMLMQHQFNTEGQKDECLKTIQDIKAKCPTNENTVRAYLMEGQIYFERKQYDKAEQVFAEAVQNFPNEEQAITMPAKCSWMKAQTTGDKKDMQHAIDQFKKLEANYPDHPDYWGEPLYILYNNTNNFPARDKYKKYYSVK